MGFDLQEVTETDPKAKFLAKSYETAIRAVIKNNPNTQFVFIDHPGELDKSLKDLENISCDTYENVLQLLT
jgi:basic membrane lipoprotein Med (substrate-binding protein (PBP1-ABC) superfamily)